VHVYLGAFGGLLFILIAALNVGRLLGDYRYRDSLLNVSAGIAVAYAFVDVFPHLAKKQLAFDGAYNAGLLAYLSHHLYLVALLGFWACVGLRAAENADTVEKRGSGRYQVLSLLLCVYWAAAGLHAGGTARAPTRACVIVWPGHGSPYAGAEP